ncbi:MAG TPA: hypothetical protein VK488_13250 [Gaiellaceae bacterium]|nr:hypothetical protein [Gaiellaceae bacterium]
MRERPDIPDAAEAAALFPEGWWGLVVFTCFGSSLGVRTVASDFQRPLPPSEAERVHLPRGSIGDHRIQPAHKGAKQALVAACPITSSSTRCSTPTRTSTPATAACGAAPMGATAACGAAPMRQWGRTTSFDVLLRAGVLGIGGQHYQPDYAYLGGSTGPKAGFTGVWGVTLYDDQAVAWAEALLRLWTREWPAVAARVGIEWEKPPLEPCDQENFLCVYQEGRYA